MKTYRFETTRKTGPKPTAATPEFVAEVRAAIVADESLKRFSSNHHKNLPYKIANRLGYRRMYVSEDERFQILQRRLTA